MNQRNLIVLCTTLSFSMALSMGTKEKEKEETITIDPVGECSAITSKHSILDLKNYVYHKRMLPPQAQIFFAYKDGKKNMESSTAPLKNSMLVHNAIQEYNTHSFWVAIMPNPTRALNKAPTSTPLRTVTITIPSDNPLENHGNFYILISWLQL